MPSSCLNCGRPLNEHHFDTAQCPNIGHVFIEDAFLVDKFYVGMPFSKEAEPPKESVGRPPKYREKLHPQLARQCAQLGWTKELTAQALEISMETFIQWEKQFPEFSEAFTRGMQNPIELVVGSLFKMATGYSHVTEKVLPSGEVVEFVERFPPDPRAMFYYLNNRAPKDWRNRQEVGFSDPDGNPTKLVIEIVDPKKE